MITFEKFYNFVLSETSINMTLLDLKKVYDFLFSDFPLHSTIGKVKEFCLCLSESERKNLLNLK